MKSFESMRAYRRSIGVFGGLIALALILGSFAVLAKPASGAQMAGAHAFTGCTQAGAAGDWGYTYAGSIILSTGAIPVAAVGSFTQDAAGHVVGHQTRSVAGSSAEEKIVGMVVVRPDCTARFLAHVYQGGQLQRTGYLNMVYTNGENNVRVIFEALVNPDGSHVPVVITIDGERL